MQVEERAIETVIPWELNPRNNDKAVNAVAHSIQSFGFQQPIVVDESGTVIVGHTRLKAASQLGLKTVPVVVAVGLTPKQANAYRLADNKTGELAEWNMEQLESILNELALETDFNMADFGFELPVEFTFSADETKPEPEKEIPVLYQVVIECNSETDQQEIYNEMTSRNLKCRLLFL